MHLSILRPLPHTYAGRGLASSALLDERPPSYVRFEVLTKDSVLHRALPELVASSIGQILWVKQALGDFFSILDTGDVDLTAAPGLHVFHHDPRDDRNILNCYNLLIAFRLV